MRSEDFLNQHEKKVSKLNKSMQLTYWEAQTTGKKEYFDKYRKLKTEWKYIYNSKDEFELVKKLLEQEEDPLIKRQLNVLHRLYLSCQGSKEILSKISEKEAEIGRAFNTFRATIDGKEYTENDIKEILRKGSEKRKAWEAIKVQGEVVANDIIELVKLRNTLAKQTGFQDYYNLSLAVREQKKEEINEIFDELEQLTNEPFRKVKEKIDRALGNRELKPWDYQDPFFQELPDTFEVKLDQFYTEDVVEIACDFFKNIGLPVDHILAKSSLYEQEGKCQHAFSIDIDKEGDVRILQNVKNNEKWLSTTLHELGHAVYDYYMDREIPYFVRNPAHIFTTEAIAMLFGRLSKDKHFLIKYGKNYKENQVHDMLKASLLIMSRWTQVMVRFEQELYANPDQDLNKLWWDLVKKYQFIDFSRDKPDWAAKIHFTIAPVYYHNYQLGELLASQLHYTIAKQYKDPIIGTEIGEFLKKNIFDAADKYHWNEMIEKATGETLHPKYFIKQFIR